MTTLHDKILLELNVIDQLGADDLEALHSTTAAGPEGSPAIVAIQDLLTKQIGPVFDAMPRDAAMYALFMYGLTVGQLVARTEAEAA